MKNLNVKAMFGLVIVAIVMGLLVFLSAGTTDFWQAWLFLAAYFVPSVWITLYLMKHDPALLERRIKGGPTAEKEQSQKIIQLLAALGFVSLLVIPGLDHRFGWSTAPVAIVIGGDLLVLIGLYIIFLVYRENSFSSATVEIAQGQKVIWTGPYAIVRHPMYAGAMLMLTGMSLGLGSFWGLIGHGTTVTVSRERNSYSRPANFA